MSADSRPDRGEGRNNKGEGTIMRVQAVGHSMTIRRSPSCEPRRSCIRSDEWRFYCGLVEGTASDEAVIVKRMV
ncbi:MAG: hypothetical protein ACXW34_07965, partial [Nitrospira sp.]